jgi:TrmH family RNA methyltransferase
LAITSSGDAERAVEDARQRGCRVVATIPRGGRPLSDLDGRDGLAVLIGGEGRGLSSALVDSADDRVTIPMRAPVESLNAAVTAALIVYHVQRQREDTQEVPAAMPVRER